MCLVQERIDNLHEYVVLGTHLRIRTFLNDSFLSVTAERVNEDVLVRIVKQYHGCTRKELGELLMSEVEPSPHG